MTKKNYMKPTMKKVELKHRTRILTGSPVRSVNTSGLDDEITNYDENGGNQGYAW